MLKKLQIIDIPYFQYFLNSCSWFIRFKLTLFWLNYQSFYCCIIILLKMLNLFRLVSYCSIQIIIAYTLFRIKLQCSLELPGTLMLQYYFIMNILYKTLIQPKWDKTSLNKWNYFKYCSFNRNITLFSIKFNNEKTKLTIFLTHSVPSHTVYTIKVHTQE